MKVGDLVLVIALSLVTLYFLTQTDVGQKLFFKVRGSK